MTIDDTRTAYDTVADNYAEAVGDYLDTQPFDVALLAVLAGLARGAILDVGTGPGGVAAHLVALGHESWGLDLSASMVQVARARHPGVRYEVGDMAHLPVETGSLGGLVAYYSVIHTEPERLPSLFAEFARSLGAGAPLLLVFQMPGDGSAVEHRRVEHGYGHAVALDAWRLSPDYVVELLEGAGFAHFATSIREPRADEKTRQGYVLARRVEG